MRFRRAGAVVAAYQPVRSSASIRPMNGTSVDLHILVLAVCGAIGVVVFAVMLYSNLMHRRSRGAKEGNFHEDTRVELAWSVIPFLILIAMTVPATRTVIRIHNGENADLEVMITAYRSGWEYEYVGTGVELISGMPYREGGAGQRDAGNGLVPAASGSQALVLPADRIVRLRLRSMDVSYRLCVPQMQLQMNAEPGEVSELAVRVANPGTYSAHCPQEERGSQAWLPIVVEVLSSSEFRAWLGSRATDG